MRYFVCGGCDRDYFTYHKDVWELSEIQILGSNEEASEKSIFTWPNPAEETATIDLQGVETPLEIGLVDIVGKEVVSYALGCPSDDFVVEKRSLT